MLYLEGIKSPGWQMVPWGLFPTCFTGPSSPGVSSCSPDFGAASVLIGYFSSVFFFLSTKQISFPRSAF